MIMAATHECMQTAGSARHGVLPVPQTAATELRLTNITILVSLLPKLHNSAIRLLSLTPTDFRPSPLLLQFQLKAIFGTALKM